MIVVASILIYKTSDKITINKYPKMNKSIKKIGNATIDATCAVLGGVHFINQSIADSVMHLEAKIKRNYDGVSIDDSLDDRMYITVQRQQAIIERYNSVKNRISKANKLAHKPELLIN